MPTAGWRAICSSTRLRDPHARRRLLDPVRPDAAGPGRTGGGPRRRLFPGRGRPGATPSGPRPPAPGPIRIVGPRRAAGRPGPIVQDRPASAPSTAPRSTWRSWARGSRASSPRRAGHGLVGPGKLGGAARAGAGAAPDLLRPPRPRALRAGRGRGSAPRDQLLADIEGVRRALGLGPIHVLGISWGGVLGLMYAARHPAGVRTLSVVGASASRGFMPRAEANARRALWTDPSPTTRRSAGPSRPSGRSTSTTGSWWRPRTRAGPTRAIGWPSGTSSSTTSTRAPTAGRSWRSSAARRSSGSAGMTGSARGPGRGDPPTDLPPRAGARRGERPFPRGGRA